MMLGWPGLDFGIQFNRLFLAGHPHRHNTICPIAPIPSQIKGILIMDPRTTTNSDDIISKEFVQNALKQEAATNGSPIPQILSYTATPGTKPGDNYISLIYSIDVKLDNATTRHLLVKCYPNHPSRQEYNNKGNMFFKELEVYSKWMPELRRLQTEVLGLNKEQVIKLPYAPFVHGECIDFQSEQGEVRKSEVIQSLDNYIMMEDIRKSYGYRMTNRREPLDIDHMRLAISALAKVHALSWAYRHHVEPNITDKFPCLVLNISQADMDEWSHVRHSNLDQAKEIYDAEFGPGNDYSAAAEGFKGRLKFIEGFFLGKHNGEGMEKLFRIPNADPKRFGKDAGNPEPWRIICHGDCWSNNFLFRYDPETKKPLEIVLVDLQLPQETCVVNDLEYLVYACTDLELRRAHTDDLLQLYHDTFNAVCELTKTPTLPGFCMDSLRFRYHRAKFLGYYMATILLPMMLKEEEKAVNLEDMAEGEDITKAFEKIASGFDGNVVFKQRLIGLMQGMIEDGVF